jgi:DNA invertase Pin-like site-specific DNA recombinase
MMNGRVWVYAAVSSAPQEATLDQQVAWGESTAQQHGWTVDRVFSGTASGRLGVRRVLEDLLSELSRLAKAQRPERILMIRLDRTGRMALETIAALAKIKRLGVTLHTRQDGDVKLESALDSLRPIFELVTAEIENSARADKMKAVHARWRDEGWHFGRAPYGTEKDADRHLVVKEPYASFVRQAFELRAAGAGFIRISREISKLAPPDGMYAGKPRRATWHSNSICAMLRCQSYRGLVVSEDLWDRVQEVHNPDWKALRASRVYPWPLSGLIICYCGWTMVGAASGKQGARTRYYVCQHPNYHGADKRPTMRADMAEAWFYDRLRGLVAKPTLTTASRAQSSDDRVASLRRVFNVEQLALQNLDHKRRMAWSLQSDGRIAAGELAARLAELQADREIVAERLAEVERGLALAVAERAIAAEAGDVLADAEAKWEAASWNDQKELSRLVALLVEGLYRSRSGALTFGVDGDTPIENMFATR